MDLELTLPRSMKIDLQTSQSPKFTRITQSGKSARSSAKTSPSGVIAPPAASITGTDSYTQTVHIWWVSNAQRIATGFLFNLFAR